MSKLNRQKIFWNILTLFIQEFLILLLLFSIVQGQNSRIELYNLFSSYTCIKVYLYTMLVLWITGCFKYSKGLGSILILGKPKNGKDGKNVLFFLKMMAIVSIVVNLIIKMIFVISIGRNLADIGEEILLYKIPDYIMSIGSKSYYGLCLSLILLPIYLRVRKNLED